MIRSRLTATTAWLYHLSALMWSQYITICSLAPGQSRPKLQRPTITWMSVSAPKTSPLSNTHTEDPVEPEAQAVSDADWPVLFVSFTPNDVLVQTDNVEQGVVVTCILEGRSGGQRERSVERHVEWYSKRCFLLLTSAATPYKMRVFEQTNSWQRRSRNTVSHEGDDQW